MLCGGLSLIQYVVAGDGDADTVWDDRSEHGADTDAAMLAPGGKRCARLYALIYVMHDLYVVLPFLRAPHIKMHLLTADMLRCCKHKASN